MDKQQIDQLTRKLKAAQIATVAAHAKRAAVHKDQAEIGKCLMCSLTFDPSPTAVQILCRAMLGTLSAEDQATAKFLAAVGHHQKLERQLRAAIQ